MNKAHRFFLSQICAFIIAVLLLSLLSFDFFHADHDCSGTDCPICAVIHIAHNARLSLCASTGFAAVCAPVLFSASTQKKETKNVLLRTLITDKVKLSF